MRHFLRTHFMKAGTMLLNAPLGLHGSCPSDLLAGQRILGSDHVPLHQPRRGPTTRMSNTSLQINPEHLRGTLPPCLLVFTCVHIFKWGDAITANGGRWAKSSCFFFDDLFFTLFRAPMMYGHPACDGPFPSSSQNRAGPTTSVPNRSYNMCPEHVPQHGPGIRPTTWASNTSHSMSPCNVPHHGP